MFFSVADALITNDRLFRESQRGESKEAMFPVELLRCLLYIFFKLPDKSAVYSAFPECAACDELVTAVRLICSQWHDFLYTNTIFRTFNVRREAEV